MLARNSDADGAGALVGHYIDTQEITVWVRDVEVTLEDLAEGGEAVRV